MPPPSLDTLRDAYQRPNESCESMIRLGSMLEDIEAAHGVGYKFEKFDDSGTADSFFIDYDTPWQTGIRGFLKDAPCGDIKNSTDQEKSRNRLVCYGAKVI